jgi:glycosyltransferase involved in cell wall biosynthesis
VIPATVIITTFNEEENLGACLNALKDFDDVIVVDSNSTDKTQEIATEFSAQVINYTWDRCYPKKRQWCLDHLETKYDFIFFVDADEIVTTKLIKEIKILDFQCAGYFVKGQYVWNDQVLRHGLVNNKLCLINKNKIEFPVVDDLDIEGMGEIEGHYQPVLKPEYRYEKIKQLDHCLIHDALDGWEERHQRYAKWEAKMIKRKAYPKDPVPWRDKLKQIFRKMPYRNIVAFLHCYIFKLGFLDGRDGYDFAKSRARYYSLVSQALRRQ